jgi:hypothetical protein
VTPNIYRIPGPYGLRERSGLGCWSPDHDAFFPLTRGPMGTNGDLGAETTTATPTERAVADEDKKELQLLQDVYGGVISADGKAYKRKVKGVWQDDVDAYVRDRNAFFGSGSEYRTYKETALKELEANNEKLRKVIEPNSGVRKVKENWKEAQTVFYCWVRKAYENHADVATGTDLPKLVLSGTSEKLREALKQVRVDYGKQFQAGGFNPRPMKLNGKYRLGTLSEHAIGNAIDIDDSKNAHITSAQWSHILTFTGKALDHATRKLKWKSAPKELYDLIADINREFVKRLAETLKEAQQENTRAKASASAAGTTPTDPLDTAMAKHDTLKNLGATFLRRWPQGFVALEWALVKELHEEGFLWGATFPDPDLHHFEL